MSELYVFTYYTLSILLIALMLYQGLTRRVELVSYRNIYLAGFILFQLVSCATVISTGDYGPATIENKNDALERYFLYVLVFLSCFFLSYHRLYPAGWMASWFKPRRPFVASDWTLLMVAVGFLALGVFMRFVGWGIPVVHYFSGLLPALPVACAVVGWVWGGRRFNLPVLLIGGTVFLVCLTISAWGIAGRRPIIAVGLALLWDAYYRMRGQIQLRKVLAWSLPILLLAMHFGGAFSLHRSHRGNRDPVAILKNTLTESPVNSISHVLAGSDDAQFTLWALDAFPDRHEPRHLFSLKYMIYHPIPRILWPEKPKPLSTKVGRLADIKGVNQNAVTLPPGILGYAQAEGGFYALLIYGLFFGQFCRFFDEVIRQNPTNPFLILATGGALGDLIGLPRGDIAVFANLNTLGFLLAWVCLLFARVIIGQKQAPQMPQRYFYVPRRHPSD